MALLTGTNTQQRQAAALKNPAATPTADVIGAQRLDFSGTYTVTGSEATGDQIPVVVLPIGAQLIPESVRVSTDGAAGTSTAIAKLGDAGDDDRYSATAITITGAVTATAVTATNAITLTPYVVATEANRTVLATITHAGAPTAGKLIHFKGQYLA